MSIEKSGIYKITNKFNGRIYVGSTIDFVKRWGAHQSDLLHNRHSNQFLQNDYDLCKKKHGSEPLTYEIVEFVSRDELLIREQYYLDMYFDEKNNTYNICKTAGNSLDRKPSEATKALWRQQRKGKDMSNATKASIAARTGVARTEETKRKIKEAHLGVPMSEQAKEKLRRPKTAAHIQKLIAAKQNISEETKNKMRKARTGTKASETTKQKMSSMRKGELNVNYGKKMSEEQKRKIRESKAKKHYGDTTFIFTHGENIRIEVKAINLTEFMKTNGLERGGFYDLLAGRLKTHKGWKVIRVDNPSTFL